MNNDLNQAATATEAEAEINKYITFTMAGYLFALPSEEILKIVATPAPSQGGMVSMGLVQLEQYSIQTIDLPKLLNLQGEKKNIAEAAVKADKKTTNSKAAKSKAAKSKALMKAETTENPPFLMVLQDADQVLWGIAVDEPPDLMDIPHYALKPVPPEKRMTRALRWVSHVVTYDLGGDRHTLLLLDLSVLLAQKPPEAILPGSANFLGIEPPMEIAVVDEESAAARKEEMYA